MIGAPRVRSAVACNSHWLLRAPRCAYLSSRPWWGVRYGCRPEGLQATAVPMGRSDEPRRRQMGRSQVFLEVARQGSVHAAAKRLNLDHSTVCRRIGKLENLLSVKLLDRTQRGIVVRDGVQEVLRHIEHMETHANSLEDAIAGSWHRNTDRPHRHHGGDRQPLCRKTNPLLERFRAHREDRAGQHSPAGRPVAQGSRHLPELLQSAPAGPFEREDRGVCAVLLLLEEYARVHGRQPCRRPGPSCFSSTTSKTCWRSMRCGG